MEFRYFVIFFILELYNFKSCLNNPGFLIQPEDAERIEGATFK